MRFRSKWKQALIIAVALHIVFIGIFGFLVPWIDGQAADKAPEPTVEFASGDGTDGDGGSGIRTNRKRKKNRKNNSRLHPNLLL